ncbi:hypothetical protein [Dactylosporangium darangshiense]|uniref:hypothetical protein n=1 Tax=Dactylosporangium darangshiense TaxID=579108 RepID=UPI00363BB635
MAACLLAAVGLFLAYLRMARAVTVNSDGASNALQAWDLFHGNPLLRGWTLSDVSFYPTELIQYGLIQLVTGVTTDQIHVAAAVTWLLVVVMAVWLACSITRNRTTTLADRPKPGTGDRPATDGDDASTTGDRTDVASDLTASAADGTATTATADGTAATATADGTAATAEVTATGRTAATGQSRTVPVGFSSSAGLRVGAGEQRGAAGGWLAAAITLAILAVPAPGLGYQTLLSSPNHTGSAVPLLLAWLLVELVRDRAWLPYVVATVLAWGALGDPLITFVGAAPLVIVTALRALRRRDFRGLDARLAIAGLASVAMSHAGIWLIERVGGLHAPRPPIQLSPVSEWPDRAATVGRMAAILFGTTRPAVHARWVEGVLQAVHLPGLVLAIVALSLTVIAVLRGTADRVDAVLAVAIVCDIGAEIVSTLPIDLLATREIAPALPMSAVLAGRLIVRWLRSPASGALPPVPGAIPRTSIAASVSIPAANSVRNGVHGVVAGQRLARAGRGLLAVVLAAQLVTLVAYAPPRAEPIEGQEAANWLLQQGLRYGLGSYWVSNNITVGTSRKVTVVPTLSGPGKLVGMCWQTHDDMYDAAKHDARFVLLEKQRPMYGTPADVLQQYGQPITRRDFPAYVIFVYDRNLLDGFTTTC